MNNKQMIGMGISALKEVDVNSAEEVNIERTKYEDGSVVLSVNVRFPAKKQITSVQDAGEISRKIIDALNKERGVR